MKMSTKSICVLKVSLLCLVISAATADEEANQCYSCRGINCLRTSVKTATENCVNSLDSCVTIFDEFTVIARGCWLSIPTELREKCNDKSNPECQVCIGKLCNHLGRSDFKCYQCDEKENVNCAENISAFSPVQCEAPTSPNSYCFTDTRDNRVKRGCSLNVKDQKECLADGKCSLCLVKERQACNDLQSVFSGATTASAAVTLTMLCLSTTRMLLRS